MKAGKFTIACMVFVLCISAIAFAADHVVISQVMYNCVGTDTSEWVELYNPTASTIDISNWKLLSFSISNADATIPSGRFIQPYGFFLIAESISFTPFADYYETLEIGNTDAGIAIKDSLNQTVDKVGWGIYPMTGHYEGIPHSGVSSEGKTLERKPGYLIPSCGNWLDTDNNSNDFIENSAPSYHNSTFSEIPCNESVGCSTDNDCNSLDDQCNEGICNLTTSECHKVPAYQGATCNDTQYCTTPDSCNNGVCSGSARSCADSVSCTIDSCNEQSDICDHAATNSLCNDSLFCNGAETCNPSTGCQAGTQINCSANNINGIAACDNNPDLKSFTWDFRNLFTSVCNESTDSCATGSSTITHTCSKIGCSAECEEDSDCNAGPNGACNPNTCACEYGAFCGDQLINQQSEVCDGISLNGVDCADFGFVNPNGIICLQDCSGYDSGGCTAICGNNALEPNEQCDDGNQNDYDGCSSLCTEEQSEVIDDLMINYIRGRIAFDGQPASNLTQYAVEVTAGMNDGYSYNGFVDDINVAIKTEGNFDTGDQLIFSSGDSFKVTADNCNVIFESTFTNGGNEGAILDCTIPPVINNVYTDPSSPTELDSITIHANATDNLAVDKVLLYYNINGGSNQLVEMVLGFDYSVNLGVFPGGTNISYYIWANDTYKSSASSQVFSLTVIALDKDSDGYTSDIDCNDFNASINPSAIEICNGIDDNCNVLVDEGFTDTDSDGQKDCVDTDDDNDGIVDAQDNCVTASNPNQEDNDLDQTGDACDSDDDNDGVIDSEDNCDFTANPNQEDNDQDGIGDVCDSDDDNDSVLDGIDNCQYVENLDQTDTDNDQIGNACDNDDDNDGISDSADNCPINSNPNQEDIDQDNIGDVCDPDDDNDGVNDGVDNCPATENSNQLDTDNDQIGDACDPDDDNDGVNDEVDNCPDAVNPNQEDSDADGIGDVCDICPNDQYNDFDQDTICGDVDNCPNNANTNQLDSDSDLAGDVCDICPFDQNNDADQDTFCADVDNCPSIPNSNQSNFDNDAYGDVCDICINDPLNDVDQDQVCGDVDNCQQIANPNQEDIDSDGIGDACDSCPNDILNDIDNDGVCGNTDNCPFLINVNQSDLDNDGFGDECEECDFDSLNDADNDGHCADLDNCPSIANTNQNDFDHDGIGDVCDTCINDPLNDVDQDQVCGDVDNCENNANTDQSDIDSDGIGDACDSCPNDILNDGDGDGFCANLDNCPLINNPNQEDIDQDGIGDVCDSCSNDAGNDIDQDGHCGNVDNCPNNANPNQEDNDLDQTGDACDSDDDNDGVIDSEDNCDFTANPNQENNDGDAFGDACDSDDDNDGIVDTEDNCDFTANPNQENNDQDAFGDACDSDDDNDGIVDTEDNCDFTANPNQEDNDQDGTGDACDSDDDNDGVIDSEDNCHFISNSDQNDLDSDDIGDACDNDADNDGYTNSNDCNDMDENIHPAAQEFCNNIDDDCDQSIDESLAQNCGSGTCSGTQTCSAGVWSSCSSQNNDCGICAVCDSSGSCSTYDDTQDSDCSLCKQCSGLFACSSQPRGNDTKEECAEDSCKFGYCSGAGSCAMKPTTTICNSNYLCSGSDAGDNMYGASNFRVPSQGYCDGSGSCDYSKSTPLCSLGKDASAEGTGLTKCIDGQQSCTNTCTDNIDNDNDGCQDSQDSSCGGKDETCNGIDDDCDGNIDEDYISASCGDSECSGATSCNNGQIVCNSWNTECDNDKCCKCNGGTQSNPQQNYDGTQNSDCNQFDLGSLATCYNNPDNNQYTWDFAASFNSVCSGINQCTQRTPADISHACSKSNCNAQCESGSDCAATDCDMLDGCYDGKYHNCDDLANTCLGNCSCSKLTCPIYSTCSITGTDNDQDGYDSQCGDCNDLNANINPAKTEICNGVDDDCDGIIDEENAQGCTTFYLDADNDAYGASSSKCLCSATDPYDATVNNDCNDNNQFSFPGGIEVCDNIDNDCDGITDESLQRACYTGPSGTEGIGICIGGTQVCSAGNWGACQSEIIPRAEKFQGCNGLDDDCDSFIDETKNSIADNNCDDCTDMNELQSYINQYIANPLEIGMDNLQSIIDAYVAKPVC